MKLTFKKFIIELLANLVIFTILSLLFVLIFFNNRWELIFPDFFSVAIISTMIFWLSFSICFFHFVFLQIVPARHYKTAARNLLLLLICIYVSDTVVTNKIIVSELYFNNIVIYDPSFWMRLTLFLSYTIVYSFIRGFAYLREQRIYLQKEKINAQLQQLQAQIEPHFIFNTLNSIYALAIEEGSEKTSSCLEELSGLFRYSLRENGADKINVSEELSFIEKYIHLNEIRFSNNQALQINTRINWDKKPAMIAPMLLITFIENAFKYGCGSGTNSVVYINLSVMNNKLTMIVKNSVHTNTETLQNGIGLTNTIKRLDMLYGGSYTLQQSEAGDIHTASLEMNLL